MKNDPDHEMSLLNALSRLLGKSGTEGIHLDMHTTICSFSNVRLQKLDQEAEQCLVLSTVYSLTYNK